MSINDNIISRPIISICIHVFVSIIICIYTAIMNVIFIIILLCYSYENCYYRYH